MGTKLLSFGKLASPARFTNCEELIDGIREILRGWVIKEVPPNKFSPPVIRIKRTSRGYQRVSYWRNTPSLVREKIRSSTVAALCGFHFEFIDWYLEENQSMLCLHCAAVQIGDGLVIFPSVVRAGKSTLTIQLAHQGHRVFCDDILPIEAVSNHGLAPGMLPRIRQPLPDDVGEQLHAFVNARKGRHDKKYLYVNLRENELAPLGDTAPIKGIVFLERSEDAKTTLGSLKKSDALKKVIQQNFVRERPAVDILMRLKEIVESASCYSLQYSNGRNAAETIRDTFENT